MSSRERQRVGFRMALAVVLLAGVWCDAWNLPPRQSAVGRWLHPYARPTGSRAPMWSVVHQDGRWVAFDPGDLASVESPQTNGAPVYNVIHVHRSRTGGFWAPTRTVSENTLRFIDPNARHPHDPTTWDREPPAAARRAASAYLRDVRGRSPEIADPLATADQHLVRILWGGWAHNLLALAAFVAGFSLMPWRGAQRWCLGRLDRAAPGLCTACGYDLAGLSGKRCPECGAEVRADQEREPA